MDGSFITEVHVVAGGISLPAWAWANASCWANQLDDHNTGTAPLSAPPPHPLPSHLPPSASTHVHHPPPSLWLGWHVINGTCASRPFKLGTGGHKVCDDLDIKMRCCAIDARPPLSLSARLCVMHRTLARHAVMSSTLPGRL